VIEVLAKLASERGAPLHLRSDNGPEFVSKAILRWLASENIGTALIDPGKQWQNGTDESFNGKFRDEFLSLEWFRSRTALRVRPGAPWLRSWTLQSGRVAVSHSSSPVSDPVLGGGSFLKSSSTPAG
jgi:transposase InsO family protein